MKKQISIFSFMFVMCTNTLINTSLKHGAMPKMPNLPTARHQPFISDNEPFAQANQSTLLEEEEPIQETYLSDADAEKVINTTQDFFNKRITNLKKSLPLFEQDKKQHQQYLEATAKLKTEFMSEIAQINSKRNPNEKADKQTQAANDGFYNQIRALLKKYPDFKKNKAYKLEKAALEAELYKKAKTINLVRNPSFYISKADADERIKEPRALFDKTKAELEKMYPGFKTDTEQKRLYAQEMELLDIKGRVTIKEIDLLRDPSELKAEQLTVQDAHALTQIDKNAQDQEEQVFVTKYLSNPATYNRMAFDKARKDIERQHEMKRLDYIRRTIDPETLDQIAIRVEMDELRNAYKNNRLELRDRKLPKGLEKIEDEAPYKNEFDRIKTNYEADLKRLVTKDQRLPRKSHL